MIRDYIIQQADIALSNYKIARTDDERQDALRTMHRLTNLAAEMYGYDFADRLPWRR